MARALRDRGYAVTATDIGDGKNFLDWHGKLPAFDAIITNPPFDRAREFIERALALTEPKRRLVAMLARIDYDCAATRRHLFADCPAFAMKLTLTRRIVWFDRPGAAPSFNHCWLMWSWRHCGAPTIAYGPYEEWCHDQQINDTPGRRPLSQSLEA
jgi:hypothetical protein